MQAGSQVTKTALHYIKLKEVVNPEGAAAKLSKIHLDTGKTYKARNNLEGFTKAFPG